MSALNRLLGLAAKALGDKTADRPHPGAGVPATPPPARPANDRYVPGQGAYERGRGGSSVTPPASAANAADRQAIARYDYLLQTADPHQVELVHREAFARLTPAQRAQVQARMQSELPAHEQPRSADPADLARAGARAEAQRPGVLRGLLARAGGGRGGRGALAGAGIGAAGAVGGVLAAVAGGAVMSAVAAPLLEQAMGMGIDFDQIASGIDLDQIAGGVEGFAGGVEGLAGGAGEYASGLGEQVSGIGEQLSNGFELPGLGDLFGR
ncbi:cation-transporting ATPase [Microbacterium sp. NPDC089189]|uniref:cation-transporting ATPase n=1 Tax=Microbacterium sp. NPDC089189 TaxID=3154972 RepID=UPI00343141DF